MNTESLRVLRRLLTEVRVPVIGANQGSAYEKFAQPASRLAIAGAAALVTVQNGQITAARIGLTGAAPAAVRLPEVEAALVGESPAIIASAAEKAAEGWEPNSDIHASEEYRQHLAKVMVRRALELAVAVAPHHGVPLARCIIVVGAVRISDETTCAAVRLRGIDRPVRLCH